VFIEAKDDGLEVVSGDNCSTGAISCAKVNSEMFERSVWM